MRRFLILTLSAAMALLPSPALAQFDGAPGQRPHQPSAYASRSDWKLVQSVNLGSVSSFTITGLNSTAYDYRLSIRMSRGAGGSASDYLTLQFGDASSTPTWFTTTTFITPLGANSTALTTSGGITRITQVQNNTTLYMGAELSLQFSSDGLVASAMAHSYFWENILQLDEGPTASQIGAMKFSTVNQSWTISYSLYAVRR